MELNIETYHHIFSNGQKLTLTVDYSGPRIIISGNKVLYKFKAGDEIYSEYLAWRSQVLVPQVLNKVTQEQALNLALTGI